jgi:hypothetical protein
MIRKEEHMPGPTVEEHLDRCGPEMGGWYRALEAFIPGLGHDTDVRPRTQYIGFWRIRSAGSSRVFAYVNFRPSRNALVIDMPHSSGEVRLEPGFLSATSGEGTPGWLRMHVDSAEDVERAKPLMKLSYQAV